MSSTNNAQPQITAVASQLVVFSLGDEEYALPITDVQEIIRYAEPRAVASESPWIKGVISLRGKIIPVCDLATRLGLPAESRAPEHFGWFAAFAGADVPASSAHTRALLGWEPTGPGLLADIDQSGYYSR